MIKKSQSHVRTTMHRCLGPLRRVNRVGAMHRCLVRFVLTAFEGRHDFAATDHPVLLSSISS
jgi:hypothetical protein